MGSTSEPNHVLSPLYDRSSNWTLAEDATLTNYLEGFAKRIKTRVKETYTGIEDTSRSCDHSKIRLQSCVLSFNLLSDTQFMESRVKEEDHSARQTVNAISSEPLETPENRKWRELKEAVALTRSVLQTAFDVVEVNVGDSSDEEDATPTKRSFREAKDPYLHRPLAYLIGSEEYNRDRNVGLKIRTVDDKPDSPDELVVLEPKVEDIYVQPNRNRNSTLTPNDSGRFQSSISGSQTSLNSDFSQRNPVPVLAPALAVRKNTVLSSSESDDEDNLFAPRTLQNQRPVVTSSRVSSASDVSDLVSKPRTASQASSSSSLVKKQPPTSIFDDEDEEDDLFSASKLRSATLNKTAKPQVAARPDRKLPEIPIVKPEQMLSKEAGQSVPPPENAPVTNAPKGMMAELAKKIGAPSATPKAATLPVPVPDEPSITGKSKPAVIPAVPVAVGKKPTPLVLPRKSTLFDDDAEDEDNLFAPPSLTSKAPKAQASVGNSSLAAIGVKTGNQPSQAEAFLSPPLKNIEQPQLTAEPSATVRPTAVPAPEPRKPVTKTSTKSSLFDDDDDDDIFATSFKKSAGLPTGSRKPQSTTTTSQSGTSNLVSTDTAAPSPAAPEQKRPEEKSEVVETSKPSVILPKGKSSLFDDDDDDLFALLIPSKPKAAAQPKIAAVTSAEMRTVTSDAPTSMLADEPSVSVAETPKAAAVERAVQPAKAVSSAKKAAASLFDDDDEDLFAVKPKKQPKMTEISPPAVKDAEKVQEFTSVKKNQDLAPEISKEDKAAKRLDGNRSEKVVVSAEQPAQEPQLDPLVSSVQNPQPLVSNLEEQTSRALEPTDLVPEKPKPAVSARGPMKWKLPGLTKSAEQGSPAEEPSETGPASVTSEALGSESTQLTSEQKPNDMAVSDKLQQRAPAPVPRKRTSASPRATPQSRSPSRPTTVSPLESPTIPVSDSTVTPRTEAPKTIPDIPEMTIDTDETALKHPTLERPRPPPSRRSPAKKVRSGLFVASEFSTDVVDEFRTVSKAESAFQPGFETSSSPSSKEEREEEPRELSTLSQSVADEQVQPEKIEAEKDPLLRPPAFFFASVEESIERSSTMTSETLSAAFDSGSIDQNVFDSSANDIDVDSDQSFSISHDPPTILDSETEISVFSPVKHRSTVDFSIQSSLSGSQASLQKRGASLFDEADDSDEDLFGGGRPRKNSSLSSSATMKSEVTTPIVQPVKTNVGSDPLAVSSTGIFPVSSSKSISLPTEMKTPSSPVFDMTVASVSLKEVEPVASVQPTVVEEPLKTQSAAFDLTPPRFVPPPMEGPPEFPPDDDIPASKPRSSSKKSNTKVGKSTLFIESDSDEDLFGAPAKKAQSTASKPKKPALFDEDSDSDDLFSK